MATDIKPALRLDQALDIARKDLLDLGLRNPLLNHRTLKARGVEVVFEDPSEIFQILVRDEKRMTFLPREGSEEDGDLFEEMTQPEEYLTADRLTDLHLQTNYTSTQLQSRLLSTYHAAKTSLEEQGVNTLYLALGMLRWTEAESSDKELRAPLILIPVELERNDARDRFHLSYTGEDIGENVSLAEKLKSQFGFKSFPEMPELEDLDVKRYFKEFGPLIESRKGWSVDPEAIALGFFSFAKLLMYRDLDPATWKASNGKSDLLGHHILKLLMGDEGFEQRPSRYSEDHLLDDQLSGCKLLQIVDADSSQTMAIQDAMDGRNMLIQGPPGTGKSQTIVNLIAAAAAEGKKVLFVAEKMAALDVVKRRLDAAGLSGPCLVLHGNGANDKTRSIKRKVIDELKKTVHGNQPAAVQSAKDAEQLNAARKKLNDYCQAVNDPIGETGESPCSAYGRLLGAQEELKGIDLPALKLEASKWTASESLNLRQLVAQLQDRLTRSGIPVNHPFWGSNLTVWLPTDRDRVAEALKDARQSLARVTEAITRLSETCNAPGAADMGASERLAESAEFMLKAPELQDVDSTNLGWLPNDAEIARILGAGHHYRSLRQKYEARLRPEAWDCDAQALRRTVNEWGSRWWRFLSSRWRAAKSAVADLCVEGEVSEPSVMLELLDGIVSAADASRLIQSSEPIMRQLYRSNWRGLLSDWELLERQAGWVIEGQRGIQSGTLAKWCIDPGVQLLNKADVTRRAKDARACLTRFQNDLKIWIELLEYEAPVTELPPFQRTFASLDALWAEQIRSQDRLHALVGFNQIAKECQKKGLIAVVTLAAEWVYGAQKLTALSDRAWLSSILNQAFRERPALAAFDGADHDRTVDLFRRLDLLQLESSRAQLAAQHSQSLPSGGGSGEIGVLWREFEKKRKLLPIRKLMACAGHAIQSIKPVFMMSPLSIANYLPPGCLTFDLVIFDEASQVKPVDALGAVVRGKQIVVVGDSKQLPPTSFFDSLVSQEESEDEDQPATSDIESILGLFSARGAQQRMLRWHYRSRHESLITVSNHLFYDNRLVVFPSPTRERTSLGLAYRRIQGAHYDRSRTRTNPVEARAVAVAVMEFAKQQMLLPKSQRDTLGVAAFSVAQMDAIQRQLELMRRSDPSCEDFFGYPPYEPFFVKNLENVQGDERDVIYISIGYARTAENFLAMNFGPLNRDGGERRLNVLISRARKRCEVFTALGSEDIDVSRSSTAGIAALKTFLQYAETGKIETSVATDRPPDSEFEEQVLRQLTALGHIVQPQVGCAGFFLDLGVVDPQHPGRYLLGIECDGARYHSARSARDRDRLRQNVLEGLGWRIHRIWSTDWFRNPDAELRKLVAAIESARLAGPAQPAPAPVVTKREEPNLPEASFVRAEAKSAGSQTTLYQCADIRIRLGNAEMHEVDRSQLADFLGIVVEVEGPVHWKEAGRRVMSGAGVKKMGSRIETAFESAVKLGVSRKLFVRRGEFLWHPDLRAPIVRDRSNLPGTSRKLELVAPEEIRRAILLAIEQSYGMPSAEVPVAACRMLGFAHVSEDMRNSVAPHRDALVLSGHLQLSGLNLTVAAPEIS